MPFLWCLLFGSLYFAVEGIWSHVFVSFIFAWCTFRISWLLYPFFAHNIVYKSYAKRDWTPIDAGGQPPQLVTAEGGRRGCDSVLGCRTALIAPAIAASWWSDKLFGRRYMNRANILYPNSRASHYWNHSYVFFLILEVIIVALALIGETSPSSDAATPPPAPQAVTALRRRQRHRQ